MKGVLGWATAQGSGKRLSGSQYPAGNWLTSSVLLLMQPPEESVHFFMGEEIGYMFIFKAV